MPGGKYYRDDEDPLYSDPDPSDDDDLYDDDEDDDGDDLSPEENIKVAHMMLGMAWYSERHGYSLVSEMGDVPGPVCAKFVRLGSVEDESQVDLKLLAEIEADLLEYQQGRTHG